MLRLFFRSLGTCVGHGLARRDNDCRFVDDRRLKTPRNAFGETPIAIAREYIAGNLDLGIEANELQGELYIWR